MDWRNSKESRDSVKRKLSRAERKYTSEEVQLHKDNPSSLWKIFNRAMASKKQERLTYSKDLKTAANEFNRFSSSVDRNAANASIRLAEDNDITPPESTPEIVLIVAYKLLSGLAPSYLCSKVCKRCNIHDRFTRKCDSLHIPLFKTASGQRTFTFRATSIWNSL